MIRLEKGVQIGTLGIGSNKIFYHYEKKIASIYNRYRAKYCRMFYKD